MTTRTLTIIKSGQRFIFRYTPGNEAEVIGAFAELAADPNSIFDWWDAALLSWQMGRRVVNGEVKEETNHAD